MVDIRPLLFANFLLVLILVTGLMAVPDSDRSEPELAQQPSSQADDNAEETSSAPASDPVQLASSETLSDPESTPENQIFKNTSEPEATETRESLPVETVAEISKPAPKQTKNESVAALPRPKPIEEATTGTLVIRSNVYDDVVLINGKPYGSTKLEMELSPGSYKIEVAKFGYKSWKQKINVRRGETTAVKAELNQNYSRVDYQNGVWKNDVRTGEGKYIVEGQFEYQGSFVDGKFHGTGSIRFTTGRKYQGDWYEGKMRGEGTLTTSEGDTYVGDMDSDQFNGDGTLTKSSGDVYTGYWIDGTLNGQGSLTTRDGLLYVGGFSDNLFHGSGSLTYPDGGHYEGSFSNGLFHGKGIEVYPDGKKYVGQFIEGLYHGKGEILNPNGSKITGTFKNGKPFGKATLTTAEGEVFTARSSEPGVCYRLKSYRATECPKLEGW